MGSYLSQPVIAKQSVDATVSIGGKDCQYAVTTMQGWRISMEDHYAILPNFGDNSILVGVFDGHGGREVAEYCTRHIESLIKASEHYKDNSSIPNALKEAYLACDKALLCSEAQEELKKIIAEDNQTDEEDSQDTFGDTESEDELRKLEEEATMPLQQVIKRKVDAKSVIKDLTGIANKELNRNRQDSSDSSQEGGTSNGDNPQDTLGFISKSLSMKLLKLINDGVSDSEDDGDDDSEEDDDDTEMVEDEESDNHEEGDDKIEEAMAESKNSVSETSEVKDSKTEVTTSTDEAESGESSRQRRKRKRDLKREEEESESKRHPTYNETSDMEGYECGTTAVVCLIKGEELTVANAGDSRCVLSCNGKAKNLSDDHAPTNPGELARIKKAGGHIDKDLRVNGGLNLSRAIGDHMYKQNKSLSLEEQMISPLPDTTTMMITSQDEFVVLASDGIWNCSTSQDVVNFIRQRLVKLKNGEPISGQNKDKNQTLSLICEELCDSCLAPNTDNDGSGCDNMTVILLLLKPIETMF